MGPPGSIRPRVLWVTAEPPDHDLGGGNIRQANLLRAVARRADVDLVLAGELRDDAVRNAVTRLIEVPAEPPRRDSKTRMRLRGLWYLAAAGQPEEVRLNDANRARLGAVVGDGRGYDVVTVEHAGLAPLLPARRTNRWAITLQFVGSQWAAQVGALAPGSRQAFWWRQEQRKCEALERRVVTSYDLVVVPSDADASHLPGPAHVVPNGVDTDRFWPAPLPPAPRLVFTGTLGYLPNADGLVWFCAEVLPQVRASVPDTSLTIVGRGAVTEVRALSELAGVEVREDVPSVLPHLHEARVAIVPLRVGTGTRLKVLEAMAAGRPVAGTSVGLEGLGLVHGRDAVVADEPAALAEGIVELLVDDARSTAMAVSGRSLVEQRFSWPQIGEAYAELLIAAPSRSRG